MSFHDVYLPLPTEWGVRGGPMFRSTKIVAASGYQQNNVEWDQPLRKWSLDMTGIDASEFDALEAFWLGREGSAHSFPWSDPSDFEVASPMQFATGNGSSTTFQLTKTYSDGVVNTVRKILHPVVATIEVRVAGTVTACTVNRLTGVVTFGSAPASGAAIDWKGRFDIPVRFESDEPTWTFFGPIASWTNVTLLEVRT